MTRVTVVDLNDTLIFPHIKDMGSAMFSASALQFTKIRIFTKATEEIESNVSLAYR